MPTLEEIRENKNFASGKVSDQGRVVAAGILAFNWLFLSGAANAPSLAPQVGSFWLLWSTGFAIAALLLDYLQYAAVVEFSKKAFDEADKSDPKVADYDYDLPSYRFHLRAFRGKQISTLLSVLTLFIYLGLRLAPLTACPSAPLIPPAPQVTAAPASMSDPVPPVIAESSEGRFGSARYVLIPRVISYRAEDGALRTFESVLLLDSSTGHLSECLANPASLTPDGGRLTRCTPVPQGD